MNIRQNSAGTRGRFQTGEFILKGEGIETYEPRFTYHGFQYVQVTGLIEKPSLDSLTGRWVHTDAEPAGEFACSNPLINRIQEIIVRTQLNNLHGIPTDCPQREKIGWTQDGCVSIEEVIYNFQMATFYTKWFRDMLDAQDPNGHACPIAPSPGKVPPFFGFLKPDGSPADWSDPWWGGALVRTPWQLYRYYGDRRVLEEAYPAMVRYLDYVGQHAPNRIAWAFEGDWVEVDSLAGNRGISRRTPPTLASTAAYFWYADIVRQTATILNRPAEAKKYAELSAAIRESFNQRFLAPDTGLYPADSQTAPALALQFGLAPEDKRARIAGELVRNIQETRTNHLSTGIVGTLYLFYALTDLGFSDLAYRIVVQEDFPSWGYMLRQGATTLWKPYAGFTSDSFINDQPFKEGQWVFVRGGLCIEPLVQWSELTGDAKALDLALRFANCELGGHGAEHAPPNEKLLVRFTPELERYLEACYGPDAPAQLDIARKFNGTWSAAFFPNDLGRQSEVIQGGCCQYSGVTTLYTGWRDALHWSNGTLLVNYFLNRASPQAEIATALPARGEAHIRLRESCSVLVRVPVWLKPGRMRLKVDGRELRATEHVDATGRFVALGPCTAGARIDIQFPLEERTTTVHLGGKAFTARWRGNYVMQMEPAGQFLPLFP